MDEKIRMEIINTFNMPRVCGKQLEKSYLLERVSVICDCTQKDVKKIFSQMKKEKIVYSVKEMPGWVGLHDGEYC